MSQDYIKKQTIPDKKEKNMETEVISTQAENLPNLVQVNENDISAASEGNQDNSVITAPISTQEVQNDNDQPSSSTNDSVDTSENNEATVSHVNRSQSLFRIEKPKMPIFAGGVREYGTFKSDFKHLIESRYSKRDAITILRSCLQGKPLEMIKGICQDYDAAWEYL